jgi:hypothetical protein
LRGSHGRNERDKIVLLRRLRGPGEQRGRACCISPRQFQTSEQYLTSNDSIGVFYQPRKVDGLVCVLRICFQLIPLVADAGQPQMRFAGTR